MSIFKKLFNTLEVDVLNENSNSDIIVKQIHKEIDDLEEKSIIAVEKMLSEIQIPTETKITEKARLMSSLGFSKENETVFKSETLIKSIEEAEISKIKTNAKIERFKYLKKKYPFDKIIPFSEFEKVLKKYNLIYAPVKSYIKDVPEKNLLEIKNSKPTDIDDYGKPFRCLSYIQFYSESIHTKHDKILRKEILKIDFDSIILKNKNHIDARYEFYEYVSKKISCPKDYVERFFRIVETQLVTRFDLFIAAPKSHFNLNNLSSIDGKHFFERQKVKIVEHKDPIAFEILNGGDQCVYEEYVRILSKWGTSDDKSYLDPFVQNEILN